MISAQQIQVESFHINTIFHFGGGFSGEYDQFPGRRDTSNLKQMDSGMAVLRVNMDNFAQSIENLEDNTLLMADTNVAAALEEPPLVYKNPFRLQEGGRIFYKLNRHTDVQIRVYDMLANEIFRRDFNAGGNGGQQGANNVIINADTFDGYLLSAGVYFFVILNLENDNIIGKGKMAIIP